MSYSPTITYGIAFQTDSSNPTPEIHENMGIHVDYGDQTVELLFMSPNRKVKLSMDEFFRVAEDIASWRRNHDRYTQRRTIT